MGQKVWQSTGVEKDGGRRISYDVKGSYRECSSDR